MFRQLPLWNQDTMSSIQLTLTEKASEYLKSVTPPGDYVTLGVKGGGCSGFTYVWDTWLNLVYPQQGFYRHNGDQASVCLFPYC